MRAARCDGKTKTEKENRNCGMLVPVRGRLKFDFDQLLGLINVVPLTVSVPALRDDLNHNFSLGNCGDFRGAFLIGLQIELGHFVMVEKAARFVEPDVNAGLRDGLVIFCRHMDLQFHRGRLLRTYRLSASYRRSEELSCGLDWLEPVTCAMPLPDAKREPRSKLIPNGNAKEKDFTAICGLHVGSLLPQTRLRSRNQIAWGQKSSDRSGFSRGDGFRDPVKVVVRAADDGQRDISGTRSCGGAGSPIERLRIACGSFSR